VDKRIDNLPLADTLTPADQDGVAAAVRGAWQEGKPLYPIGGGTQLAYGARPAEPGLGLSLAGLNRVIDYPARDLTITVEAGVTIAELAGRLAAERQRLPVDVPFPAQATVGGAVALNAAGPRQFRWGTLRDYVIGVRAIDGSGTAFSAGGRVVKNAAGYNLCRLLTGSLGTLGVIVQVTLMVKPMPQTSAFVACDVPDGDTAEKLLAGLIHTRTLPSAVELLAGPGFDLEGNPVGWVSNPSGSPNADAGRVGNPSHAMRLAVGLEGSAAEVEWMIAQLQEEWRQAGVTSTITLPGDQADPLWNRLTEFAYAGVGRVSNPSGSPDADAGRVGNPSHATRQGLPVPSSADGDSPLVVQIHVAPSVLVALMERLRELDPRASIQAHAGSGVVFARFPVEAPEAAAMVDQRLRPAVRSAGGSMVVLGLPQGAALGRESLFGPAPEGWAVMQSIQRQFDPKGILNRGRFLFAPPA